MKVTGAAFHRDSSDVRSRLADHFEADNDLAKPSLGARNTSVNNWMIRKKRTENGH